MNKEIPTMMVDPFGFPGGYTPAEKRPKQENKIVQIIQVIRPIEVYSSDKKDGKED